MLEGALALLACRRGEESDEALLGALMEAEFQASMILLARTWVRAHTKK
jgi:hypothetical protein